MFPHAYIALLEPGQVHVVQVIKKNALTAALEHGLPQPELLWMTLALVVKLDFGLQQKVLFMFPHAYIAQPGLGQVTEAQKAIAHV